MHIRATQYFHHGLLLSTPKEIEKKQNYLHGKAPNKQKEEHEIFLGFLFNYYYYSKKSKLTKSYTKFFGFS